MKRIFADDKDFVYYLETGNMPEQKWQLDLFGTKIKDAKKMER